MVPTLEALFSPGTIGTMTVRNRLVMPPMGTNYATWTGEVTDRLVRYYAERARGGVGLITVEFTYVHPSGRPSFYALGIHEDGMIPGLRRLTDAIHAEGAKVSIQIAHGGRRCRSAITGIQPMAPSAVPCLGGEVPRALSTAEIGNVVSWFADGARRAREAGFDAVTIHLANGYLLQSFISPYANHRTDEYGGSLANRMRLPLEVVDAVRREVGKDFPLLVRLCVDEFVDGGFTLEEARKAARMLEEAGVDGIDAAVGIPETLFMIGPPMAIPQGFEASHARAIKEVVGIPVFTVGRINDPLVAERILEEGSADFVCMGRPLLADPELPRKAREGRLGEICPCIACNEGCNQRLYSQLDISCVTNPRVGREAMYPEGPAAELKKVLVVGGGPAGMMAAVTAAARGHRVVLCERGERLGGQLLMGRVPPHKEEIERLRGYLEGQVGRSGVEVRLGAEVSEGLVRELGPDVVVVATGARPVQLRIPTVGNRIISAWDVLAGRELVGGKVVVIGGGEVGCELAELLASQGKEVVILELVPELAANMEPRGRALLLQRLRELGVKVLLKSAVKGVSGSAVEYEQGELRGRIEGVESVVSAVGSAAENGLVEALKGSGVAVYTIGDSVKPRRILEAMREGFELAYAL